jgi:SAP domain-containing new25/Domain of unknown function (DUF6434)
VTTTRPQLGPQLTGTELRRWYWLRSELADFARSIGVSAAGGKTELTDRLAAALDDQPLPAASPATPVGRQLTGSLTDDTVIPPGQRSSQALRSYFEARVGPGFRFDAAMRSFIGDGAGRTLGEAVDHWHATRSAEPSAIAPQFELNRFTRAWHLAHPGGSRTDLLAAWNAYRALPVDARAAPESAQ